jgi:phosphatidate cytidylyltransferase
MLKQRIITALVLAATILVAILLLPAKWFLALTGLVVLQAAWEWSALADIKKLALRIAYLVLVLLAMLLVLRQSPAQREFLLLAGCLWWIHAYYLIRRYPALGSYWKNPWFLASIGLLVLLPAWAALVHLSDSWAHMQLILLFLGLVAAADIGAYFAGRAFGKHKLAPQVSPNKTWEGLVGGMMLSCTLALLIYLVGYRGGMPGSGGFGQLLLVLAAALSIAIFSVVGDLFESIAKRQAGVKDSGSLLPGHGGMLDRIDSITAALPLYALALKLVPLP